MRCLLALELHPGLPQAYYVLIWLETGDVQAQSEILKLAIASCSKCTLSRYDFMKALAPQWGAPRGAQEKFASEASTLTHLNPRLRLLAAYPLQVACKKHRQAKEWRLATAKCEEAQEIAPNASSTIASLISVDARANVILPAEQVSRIESVLERNPYQIDMLEELITQTRLAEDWKGFAAAITRMRRLAWMDPHGAIASNLRHVLNDAARCTTSRCRLRPIKFFQRWETLPRLKSTGLVSSYSTLLRGKPTGDEAWRAGRLDERASLEPMLGRRAN